MENPPILDDDEYDHQIDEDITQNYFDDPSIELPSGGVTHKVVEEKTKPVYENQSYLADIALERIKASFEFQGINFDDFKTFDFQVSH